MRQWWLVINHTSFQEPNVTWQQKLLSITTAIMEQYPIFHSSTPTCLWDSIETD